MDNSFFLLTDKSTHIVIERFHICTWEFKNSSALIEFGFEVNIAECHKEAITLDLFVPWLSGSLKVTDLYESLKDSANSKFIFNDAVHGVIPLDDGQNMNGVIHEFTGRNSLCILPITTNIVEKNRILEIEIDLTYYKKKVAKDGPNIYFRFYLEPAITSISTRKTGISKSTIIYDIKINEKRSLPDHLFKNLKMKSLCKISNCFCLNVVPNSFELTFLDSATLKNVRTLEFESFHRYLKDKRVEEDELLVIFNKKEAKKEDKLPSYSFFSIFYKERIGVGQFALAVMLNLVCGILLFLPAFRQDNKICSLNDMFHKLPFELYFAISIDLILLLYFIWPSLNYLLKLLESRSKTILIKNR